MNLTMTAKTCLALDDLNEHLLFEVLLYLNARSVLSLYATSQYYRQLVSQTEAGLFVKFDLLEQQGDLEVLPAVLRKRSCQLEKLNLCTNSSTPRLRIRLYDPFCNVESTCFQFRSFEKLRSLILSTLPIEDASIYKLAQCSFPSLLVLNLSNLVLLQSGPVQALLRRCPNLVYFNIEHSEYAAMDDTLMTLANSCRQLKTLSIAGCMQITHTGLVYAFQRMIAMKELSLAQCAEIEAAEMAHALSCLRNLRVLSLESCYQVDDMVVFALAEHCKNLTVLGVEHCDLITDPAMAHLIRSVKLTFLSADGCLHIALSTCESISQYCLDSLVDLYLNSCICLTDELVKLIANSCRRLHCLGIEECTKLTDAAAMELAVCCSELTVLGLNGDSKITDTGILFLLDKNCNFERLYLSYTSITNRAVATIAQKCQNLASLSLVGCDVDYEGLCHLGKTTNACSATLRDLHLSKRLKFPRYLYQNALLCETTPGVHGVHSNDQQSINLVSETSSALVPTVLDFEFDMPAATITAAALAVEENGDEDSENNSLPSINSQHLSVVGETSINLQALLFPVNGDGDDQLRQKLNGKRRCRVYLK